MLPEATPLGQGHGCQAAFLFGMLWLTACWLCNHHVHMSHMHAHARQHAWVSCNRAIRHSDLHFAMLLQRLFMCRARCITCIEACLVCCCQGSCRAGGKNDRGGNHCSHQ